MLFNSYEFLFLFLPVVFFVYFILNNVKKVLLARTWLAAASIFFYSWWDIRNLPILLFSILFNYIIGSLLIKLSTHKKFILFIGISLNLSLLGYYKYANFFIETTNQIYITHLESLNLILPLGISFFTFTQIAYLVDAYKGIAKEYNLINYILFVTFFPHLIAGPILHHKEMMPQFASLRVKVINWQSISHGLLLFSIGLFKKVIIADTLALWANPGFKAANLMMLEAWATALSYTFQLYFDFSGYTDMAIGIGLLFNIKLPQNFDSPYKSASIIEFWRRWHMTLSRFLRDYLYIPLGGNRKGNFRRYINLLATMTLGGLWHGAAWTFVIWGFLHGLALVINHLWRSLDLKMHWLLSRLLTFLFLVLTWVIFRAENFHQAKVLIKGMFNIKNIGIHLDTISPYLPAGRKELVILFCLYLFISFFKNSIQVKQQLTPNWKWAFIVSFLLVTGILGLNQVSEFLYFQF